MAKVIPFYIPTKYKSKAKYVRPELRGKVLIFTPKAA